MRAVLLLVACVAFGAHGACDVDYRLEPRWDATPRHFAASLAFDAADRTRTRLAVSPDWGGARDFHRALRKVEGTQAEVTVAAEGNEWVVTHPAGRRISVRFEVHGAVEVDSGTLDPRDFYRNMLGERHFHLFGLAALPLPQAFDESSQERGCVTFAKLPRTWSIAGSLADTGLGSSSASFEGRLPDVVRSLFVGGDFRVLRREIAGNPVLFAIRGDWKFDDARFADAATAVIRTHREFWNDHDFPRYLVTLIPNRVASGSTGGTGVTGAFAMHASHDFTVPGQAFDFLIGHEHLHAWMPKRLGGAEKGPNEASGYWFSEGFTNYLTHRLLLRSGVWTLEEYARALNAVFFEEASSPVARARNERIREDFWKSGPVNRLPYVRGELVALDFARLLERAGTTLETVLRRLATTPADGRPATERFAAAASRHVPATRANLEAYIDRGESIPADTGALGPCFEGRRESRAPFALGFDGPTSLRSRKVIGLVSDGPAERAGLREGMPIEAASIRYGDTETEVLLRVRVGDAARDVRYLPRGAALPVMQYFVKDEAGTDAECAKWLRP